MSAFRISAIIPVLFAGWCLISTNNVAFSQLSFEAQPINYSESQANDPVAALVAKVESGEVVLARDAKTGFLNALLIELDVLVSSQTLVFSKTSHQRHKISPSNPRAIYFNDETYIGWIPHAELIEIASIDPVLGTIFYTIEQDQVRTPSRITRRTERCLFCHASSDTGRIPGLMMQSVYTDVAGNRAFPDQSVPTKANGPIGGRWAGWFVSGTHGKQQHLGNLTVDSNSRVEVGNQTANANITDLAKWFDVDNYLAPHSDLVALLVLQHQVTTHNLLIDANHRARQLIHAASTLSHQSGEDCATLSAEDRLILDQIAEEVVDGLLMVGQQTFTEPVAGTSEFAREFSQRGPRDSLGRSLRSLDLRQTLFQYPCSYLIYSDSFNALPLPLLAQVSMRLNGVLTSADNREKYRHLSTPTRKIIFQILRETKPKVIEQEGITTTG